MLIIAPGQEENRDTFSIFFNMKVYSVFSLESPHGGIFFKGLKNAFETTVVNEPTVFEPLEVYRMNLLHLKKKRSAK